MFVASAAPEKTKKKKRERERERITNAKSHLTEEETKVQAFAASQGQSQDQNSGLLDSGPGFYLAWEPRPQSTRRASAEEGLCVGRSPHHRNRRPISEQKHLSFLFLSGSFPYEGEAGSETAEAGSPRWKHSTSMRGSVAAGRGQGVGPGPPMSQCTLPQASRADVAQWASSYRPVCPRV